MSKNAKRRLKEYQAVTRLAYALQEGVFLGGYRIRAAALLDTSWLNHEDVLKIVGLRYEGSPKETDARAILERAAKKAVSTASHKGPEEADVLDPKYPLELVEEELREAGVDPDQIRKRATRLVRLLQECHGSPDKPSLRRNAGVYEVSFYESGDLGFLRSLFSGRAGFQESVETLGEVHSAAEHASLIASVRGIVTVAHFAERHTYRPPRVLGALTLTEEDRIESLARAIEKILVEQQKEGSSSKELHEYVRDCLVPFVGEEDEPTARRIYSLISFPQGVEKPSFQKLLGRVCAECGGTGVSGFLFAVRCPTCKGVG